MTQLLLEVFYRPKLSGRGLRFHAFTLVYSILIMRGWILPVFQAGVHQFLIGMNTVIPC